MGENKNLPRFLLAYFDFKNVRTDFQGWKMDNPENENDFFIFANRNEYRFVNVVNKGKSS